MLSNKFDFQSEVGAYALSNRLKRLSDYLIADTNRIYKSNSVEFDQGLHNTLHLLSVKGELSIKQISEYLKVTHPAIVQVVNKLINKKFAVSFDFPSDKRVTIVKLTKKGKEVYESFQSIADKINLCYKEIINEVDSKFLITIGLIEDKVKFKSVYERVIELMKKDQIKNVKIVKYSSEYQQKFKELNLEWLNKYFEVEAEDEKALNNPESYYIKNGGEIFFAILNENICGTCAVKKIDSKTYELSKMAVPEIYQGKQVGKKLALTAIGYAYERGAAKIVLETSPKLINAINLYKKLGFEIVNEDNLSNYKRALFKMELKLK